MPGNKRFEGNTFLSQGGEFKDVKRYPFQISDLAGPIGMIGGLGATFLGRYWAKKDRDYANKYNSPEEQLKRLRAAGLPMAAMYGNMGGTTQQSEIPRSSEIDPSLGSAKLIEGYAFSQQRRAELKLLNATADEKTAQATMQTALANILMSDPRISEPVSVQARGVFAELKSKEAMTSIKENEAIIEDVDARLKVDWYKKGYFTKEMIGKIEQLYRQIDVLNQNIDYNTFQLKVQNALEKQYDKDPNWLKALILNMTSRYNPLNK